MYHGSHIGCVFREYYTGPVQPANPCVCVYICKTSENVSVLLTLTPNQFGLVIKELFRGINAVCDFFEMGFKHDSKLAIGVKVCVSGCLSLYVSSLMN